MGFLLGETSQQKSLYQFLICETLLYLQNLLSHLKVTHFVRNALAHGSNTNCQTTDKRHARPRVMIWQKINT